jgi:RNA polymerase sigma-70 factor, ECF subfamily
MPVVRDNETWVRELGATGRPEAKVARAELRALLVEGLTRALSPRGVARDLCEDFAQEALLRVHDRLTDFRGDCRFTTWALTIATRLAFDELRHKRWKDVPLEPSDGTASPLELEPREEANQERALARRRVLKLLARVIESELTDRQRAVLSAELSGMPHAEIAIRLGTNRNALYKLSHDARKRVKAGLLEAGLSSGDMLWGFQ